MIEQFSDDLVALEHKGTMGLPAFFKAQGSQVLD